jgi:putative DNA methylase
LLDYSKSFIETQFPVSKVSKESYKERKANLGQTLTGLGKWWGRKPLILVRATVLGTLLPVSDDPKKDKEIFLKLLTMDNEGLLLRKSKSITTKEVFKLLINREKEKYFTASSNEEKPTFKKGITKAEKSLIQELAFNRLSYDEKLKYCDRPEHITNLPESSWKVINEHLETTATNLQELVAQLGEKRFGHTPKIGDCFAGGGSIPFESARIGADIFASDLNPISSLLTWSALNITGATNDEIKKIRVFQEKVFNEVDKQISEWGIEHNEEGHRADAYLYCNESICPECGYKVPLAPSWIVGKGTKTVAILVDNGEDGFDIDIVQGASKEKFEVADRMKTINGNNLYCPHCKKETPIAVLRKDRKDDQGNTIYGLRRWNKNEFIPRQNDVFQERLYCIRYVEEYVDEKDQVKTNRYFRSPIKEDLEREEKVRSLLNERLTEWQEKGYIPSDIIEEGYNNDQPIRERGWQYWHQLFSKRQLLVHGLFAKFVEKFASDESERVIGLLGLNRLSNWNSKLSQWSSYHTQECGLQTFYNQAFNTFFNHAVRAFYSLDQTWFFNINASTINSKTQIQTCDAREVKDVCDIWITDPPYADAVNYHELTEFFLAWDKNLLEKTFPQWYADSKRILAVKGTGEGFNNSMIEIYRNLAKHMPDNGIQVVMFTHQDVQVWAELAMILWSSGLRVVSAWNVATETESTGLKEGNYVKGTVLLVLKKQTSNDVAFQDELYRKIKKEVQFLIDSMRDLDDKEDPNFTDADYLLASYASSLKVLTAYKDIEGIDVKYELSKPRNSGDEGPIESIINKAVKIAFDYLIPEDFDNLVWRDLLPEERFFIRGLELEMANIYQVSAYQELARGFGVGDYKDLFENFKANSVRLKTAYEFRTKGIDKDIFGGSLMRNVLASVYQCVQAESTTEGKNYLKAKYDQNNEYWEKRSAIIVILEFLSRFENISHMQHWHQDSYYARLLKEAIRNDGI